jgi:hypothetical protein
MPSYRAFSREQFESAVQLRYVDGRDYFTAIVKNISFGGAYVETPQWLPTNSRLYMRLDRTLPQIPQKHSFSDVLVARVRWCHEISQDESFCYGCGLHFLLNKCDLCDETVPYEDLHELKNKVKLCGYCRDQVYNTDKGKIQKRLEDHLLGNVL